MAYAENTNRITMTLDEFLHKPYFLHKPDEKTINKMFMEKVPGLKEKIPKDKYTIIVNLLKKSKVQEYTYFVKYLEALESQGYFYQLTDEEYSNIFNALFMEKNPETIEAVHLRSIDDNIYGVYYIIELRPNKLYMIMVKRTGYNYPFEFHIVEKGQLNTIIKQETPDKTVNIIKSQGKIYKMTTFLNPTTRGGRRRIHCAKTKKHRTKRRKTRKHN